MIYTTVYTPAFCRVADFTPILHVARYTHTDYVRSPPFVAFYVGGHVDSFVRPLHTFPVVVTFTFVPLNCTVLRWPLRCCSALRLPFL